MTSFSPGRAGGFHDAGAVGIRQDPRNRSRGTGPIPGCTECRCIGSWPWPELQLPSGPVRKSTSRRLTRSGSSCWTQWVASSIHSSRPWSQRARLASADLAREEAVAGAPDHQGRDVDPRVGRRRRRWRIAARYQWIIDRDGPGLGPGPAVAVQVGLGERPRAAGRLEGPGQGPPVPPPEAGLGQAGELEVEDVPAPQELGRDGPGCSCWNATGCGALRMASRSTRSGCRKAVHQATMPPQSWPTSEAERQPAASISPTRRPTARPGRRRRRPRACR